MNGGTSLGRFGWKANVPSVEHQNASAFHGDIGITSSLFPDENCPPEQSACGAGAQRRGAGARRRQAATASPSTPGRWPCPPAADVGQPETTRARSCSAAWAAHRATCPSCAPARATSPRSSNQVDPSLHRPAAARHGSRSGRRPARRRGDRQRVADAAAVGDRPGRDREPPHPLPARRPRPQPQRGHPLARRRGRGRPPSLPRAARPASATPSSRSWSPCEARPSGRHRCAPRRPRRLFGMATTTAPGPPPLGDRRVPVAPDLPAVVDEIIVPRYEPSRRRRQSWRPPLAALCAQPGAAPLDAARQQWAATREAWRQTVAFGVGPAMTLRTPSAVDFAASEAKVQEVLDGSEPLTAGGRRRPGRQRPRARDHRAAPLRRRLRHPDHARRRPPVRVRGRDGGAGGPGRR